jgi:hypothetical protein
MSFELPLWMQENLYPARLDRLLILHLFRGRERVLEGWVASPRAAGGANSSVDVTAGAGIILGEDEDRQGAYLVTSDTATYEAGFENFAMPVKPGSNSRIDVVGVLLRDSQAKGVPGPDDALLSVVSGTTATTPSEPTIPVSFIPIARVVRSASETAILAGAITDIAARGYWPYGSGDAPPPTTGVPGDLYLEW